MEELARIIKALNDPTAPSNAVCALLALGTAIATSPGRRLHAIERDGSSSRQETSMTSTMVPSGMEDTFPTLSHNTSAVSVGLDYHPISGIAVTPVEDSGEKMEVDGSRVSLFKVFFLLRCAVPRIHGKEVGLIVVLFALLVGKISYTVRLANMIGTLAGCATKGDLSALLREVVYHLLITCAPHAIIAGAYSFIKELIELRIRAGLSYYFDHRYLKSKVFFRIACLQGVDNVHGRLTTGIKKWSSVLLQIVHSFFLTVIEILFYTRVLWKCTGGWHGPACAWVANGVLSGLYSYWFAPPIQQLTHERMARRSAFEEYHRNIRSFAEEIALTNASTAVQQTANMLFKRLTDHSRVASYLHCCFQLGNIGLGRYFSELVNVLVGSMALGYQDGNGLPGLLACLSSTPLGTPSVLSTTKKIQIFSRTTYLNRCLGFAFNEMIRDARVFQVLKAYTNDLFSLVHALDSADEIGETQSALDVPNSPSAAMSVFGVSKCQTSASPTSPMFSSFPNPYVNEGIVSLSTYIQFIKVPISLPNGRCLCKSLSFYVKPGMNLLITGPNGCGKSSILRLLGELWPIQRGIILKPSAREIFFVPQKPYIFRGSLLEHIIYPDRAEDFTGEMSTLYALLQMVGLERLIPIDDATSKFLVCETCRALSTGEQQRLAFARLFYHKPRYAVLDESSSAMDQDMESMVYRNCQRLGISLITVAHRRSVWKYHNWILCFDGKGGYLFSSLVVNDKEEIIELPKIEMAGNTTMTAQQSARFTFEEFANAIL